MKQGLCVGGPLDGELRPSRYDKGFLLIDKEADIVWVYNWSEQGNRFQCREPRGEKLISDPEKPDNRWRAADEHDYDVVAYGAGDDVQS